MQLRLLFPGELDLDDPLQPLTADLARHSAEDIAIGFSTNTCFPSRNAAKAKSKCDETGVAMTIASIDESSINWVELLVVFSFG